MKKLALILPLLISCKTTEKCDAYGSVITFPPMHVHDWNDTAWQCSEFPADTLDLNKNSFTLK